MIKDIKPSCFGSGKVKTGRDGLVFHKDKRYTCQTCGMKPACLKRYKEILAQMKYDRDHYGWLDCI